MNYGKAYEQVGLFRKRPPKAVICGSFRRDTEALQADFQALREAGCEILSPTNLEFVSEVDGFVFGRGDLGRSTAQVEEGHLRAMEEADFVWLHCPKGYVGTSATMELGFAQALGLRVFASELPIDVTLAGLVVKCDSPRAAVSTSRQALGEAPAHALLALQSYYVRAAELRGWSDETALQTLDLLRGEIDELEEALNQQSDGRPVALELADVQLYVVHLANLLGLDLSDAVREKERINHERFESAARLAA